MLSSLSPRRFFSLQPTPQTFESITHSLFTQDSSTWKPSPNFSITLASLDAGIRNAKFSDFLSKSIKKGLEKPKTFPQVLQFLSSSFEKTHISQAIVHSLGVDHPLKNHLSSWETHKIRWEGSPTSPTRKSYRSSFSIPLVSSFLETFWSAIDDLDSSQRYSSIWEKYLILEILYRCCSLPFHMVKYLQIYFLRPLKVYLLVSVGSFLTLALGRLYQTYQEHPDRLVYIEKCQPVNPSVPPQLGAWKQLLTNIPQKGARIFLTGKPGCGKTSLIEELLYRQNMEPALEKLVFVHLKIADIVTDQNYGYGEILEKIKRKMEPWQERLVLIVDEAQRLQKHQQLLETFRTKIMDPLPRLRCLFATTSEEFTPFTSDEPFVRRITQIPVQEPTKADLLRILQCEQRKYLDWPIPEDLLQTIVEKVLPEELEQNPQSPVGAISRATQFLKNTVESYQKKVQSDYTLPTLQNVQESLDHAKKVLADKTMQGIQNIDPQILEIRNLEQQFTEQTDLNAAHQQRVKIISPFFQAHKWAKERSTFLAQKLLVHPEKDTMRNELLLLDFFVLPALATKIRTLAVETLALPTRVDP